MILQINESLTKRIARLIEEFRKIQKKNNFSSDRERGLSTEIQKIISREERLNFKDNGENNEKYTSNNLE